MKETTRSCILIHYHEIALKGKNRPLFISQLIENLKKHFVTDGLRKIENLEGRIALFFYEDAKWDQIEERCRKIIGVCNYSRAFVIPSEIDQLKKALYVELGKLSFNSFRVSTKRAYKKFRLNSMEVNAIIGQFVKETFGKSVDLRTPDINIWIEILKNNIFFYFEKRPGLGGLPVGTSGRVLSLISGGIDSPVAAYRMMKRGCNVDFIHFHSFPYLSRESQEKVKKIVNLLNEYQYSSKLYLVPFGDIQKIIVSSIHAKLRILIYRRMMIRIAERIAKKIGAEALITGESLGQVSSQTLKNISVINEVSTLPVLRPLIGMDKMEIIEEAKRIGTYEISIIPDEDCCQLFVPRNPSVKARIEDIRMAEGKLRVEELVDSAIKGAEEIVV